MNIKKIFFFFLLTSSASIAQTDSLPPAFHQPKFDLKLAPLAPIDQPAGEGFRMGIEYKIFKHWNHYIDGTYYFPNTKYFSSVEGYRLRTDFRYYFTPNDTGFYYTGVSFMYKNQRLNFLGSVIDDSLKVNYRKQYRIKKEILAFDIIIGRPSRIYKNFYLDFTAGIGGRIRKLALSDISSYEIAHLNNIDPGTHPWVNISLDPKLDFTVDVLLSAKLCYIIK